MIDKGKQNLLGILIDAVDYERAVERIIQAAHNGQSYSVSALAVHGIMTGVQDKEHQYRLNHLDMVVPDGQPVRWGLNWLHGCQLPDRVYGPTLTLKVCERAAKEMLPIYLYGSTFDTISRFVTQLQKMFPGIQIAGHSPSLFRKTSIDEMRRTTEIITKSGAQITLVGLGCPRQEVWAYEYRDLLNMPILAVGAAFDFHAGTLKQAPSFMQKSGLEWLFRLYKEPRRLWKRYLYLNPQYLSLLFFQMTKIKQPDPELCVQPRQPIGYG